MRTEKIKYPEVERTLQITIDHLDHVHSTLSLALPASSANSDVLAELNAVIGTISALEGDIHNAQTIITPVRSSRPEADLYMVQ